MLANWKAVDAAYMPAFGPAFYATIKAAHASTLKAADKQAIEPAN